MRNTVIGEIFSKLDMVVLERLPHGKGFSLLGQKVPEWFKLDEKMPCSVSQVTQLVEESEFLRAFLESEAIPFWQDHESGELSSESWSEPFFPHVNARLEAIALAIGQTNWLIIKRLGQEFALHMARIQEEQKKALKEDQEKSHELQKGGDELVLDGQAENKTDAVAVILHNMKIGAMITDQDERITFLNDSGKRVLGVEKEDLRGQVLWKVLPFTKNDKRAVKGLIKKSSEERTIVSVNTLNGGEGRSRLKIEVQEDPRDSRQKIFFLHNITNDE
ncbi:MAG: hypothetical protein NPIRA05_15830 [Nitrospirales bacterium]|nr:MAG: hypothetical protein NPIRA05_15830 [Nitrospirales bacterium]